MQTSPNPNDLITISDAVLDGTLKFQSLDPRVQGDVIEYWNVSGTSAGPSQQDLEAVVSERAARDTGSIFDSPVFKPIEWLGAKLYKVYSASVSPIISAGAMATRSLVQGGRPSWIGEDGELDALADYWHYAHEVSPGQAVWQIGLSDEELEARGISPVQMKADKKAVREGRIAPGMTTSAQYFSDGAAKYVTGGTDFAVSWYADPLVLVGKSAAVAKGVGFTRPTERMLDKAAKQAEKKGLPPEAKFDIAIEKPVMQKMADELMAIKAAHPDNAALVMRERFKTFSRSANGDVLARAASLAKTRDDVVDVLRISIGDDAALETLKAKDAVLAGGLAASQDRLSRLDTYYLSRNPAWQASATGVAVKGHMDSLVRSIGDMEKQSRIISSKMDAWNKLDALHFNSITSPVGRKIRGSNVLKEGKPSSLAGPGKIRAVGRLAYNSSLGLPVFLIRSYMDIRPTHYIDIHANDSYRQVEASISEAKWMDRPTRERMVSDYIKATPDARGLQLVKIETEVVAGMVREYNLKNPGSPISHEMAQTLYRDFAQKRRNGQANVGRARSFGTAQIADPANPGMTVSATHVDAGGGVYVPSPIFETQLANSHVMMDFNVFNRILQKQGSTLQKLYSSAADKTAWLGQSADVLNTYWKFAQLFRLGYTPRTLADDYFGQLARYGPMAALDRAVQGGKVKSEDFFRGRWMKNDVAYAQQRQAQLEPWLEKLRSDEKHLTSELARQRHAGSPNVAVLEDDLKMISDEIASANDELLGVSKLALGGPHSRSFRAGRQVFPGAYAGTEGKLFSDLASGSQNMRNMMGREADFLLKRQRRLDWEDIDAVIKGPEVHMEAWLRKVNQQIAQSAIGRQALLGKSESELVQWMRTTPEGRQYRKDINLKNISDRELAMRVKAEVDGTLDPSIPAMDAARQAALTGSVTREMLEVIPQAARPRVNSQSFSYAAGNHPIAELTDRMIDKYFNIASTLPAQHLIKNPLFNQVYKANVARQYAQMRKDGVGRITEDMRQRVVKNAREFALRDVKRFTFTMDHETKMAFGLRHFGAFFGAQSESWNRWARIIGDDPSALGRVTQAYGASSRSGITVDQDGNVVDGAGFVTNPETGEKKLTKYGERKMLIQVPDYLGGKALNKWLGRDETATFTVPLSSAELILNSGDGALPVGVGPFVQLAANDLPFTERFDANGNPNIADWYKKLGVLPFGPKESAWDYIIPTTGKRAEEWLDDESAAHQRDMYYMMQVEDYKWREGLRETRPTWEELQDRADRWGMARTAFAFVMPLSINSEDPYQFFRDEYQRYQKLDADSADQKFYDKYGDSFYAFSQSMSKNNTGLRPTAEAVKMSKYYQGLIDKVGPEYAGIIVGHEGEGKYSEGAYFYQKTHSAAAGNIEMQRDAMGAREAWDEAQEALGWQQYNSVLGGLYARLFDMGFTSFSAEGAEDLKAERDNIVIMLSSPLKPNGEENEFYNPSWFKAFSTIDKSKYDRRANDLWKIVSDPELWAKSVSEDGTPGLRSDLYTLRAYLETRRQTVAELAIREADGGSGDIDAEENLDLKEGWDAYVMAAIEQDTKFQWLHTRWLSGDLGFNKREEEAGV